MKEPEAGTTAPQPKFSVRGRVSYANGAAASPMLVRAFDKDMRSEQLLGDATTLKDGTFSIPYFAQKFSLAEVGTADLRISVCTVDGREIATTPIHFNASTSEVIDVVLPTNILGPSEYEILVSVITPDLQGVALKDLTSDDVQFLVGDTNENAARIRWVATANLLNQSIDKVPPEIFYGLFRQGMTTDLQSLCQVAEDSLLRAIQTSISQNVIRSFSEKEIQTFLSALHDLAVQTVLKPSGEKQSASLGDVLAFASLSPEKQRSLAAVWVRGASTTDSDWTQLQKSVGLSDAETAKVRMANDLAGATGGYIPLMKELQRRSQSDPALAAVAGFASYDLQLWTEIVKAVGAPSGLAGKSADARAESYATSIANYFEFHYPTNVIASRIQQGLFGFDEKQKSDLNIFIQNNPTLEFGANTNPLGIFLAGKEANWKGVKDLTGAKALLATVDRVSKLTSSVSQTAALVKDGIQSAYAIVSIGKQPFNEKYVPKFGATQTQQIFTQSQRTYNTALLVYVENQPSLKRPLPYVLTGVVEQASTSNDLPLDWRSLFGSIDICDCDECSSLYSASAYLVDTLRFLQRGTTVSGKTPLDVLLDRRPDIAQVELTCGSTDTELPYIDLVNEILEQTLVSRSWDVDSALHTDWPTTFNQGQIPDSFRQELLGKFYPLSDSARVEVIHTNLRWDVRDTGWRFTVFNKGALLVPPFVKKISISAWPQTGGNEGELAANAEHLTPDAYDKYLSKTVFPGTLPYDLWLETVRVYLNHLGISRLQLMEQFFNGDFEGAAVDPSIVNEDLGLSQLESDICTGVQKQDPNQPVNLGGGPERIFDFWGLIQNVSLPDPAGSATPIVGTWDAVLQHVDIFLTQSGLSYVDLLELLESYFINPIVLDVNGKPKRDATGAVIRVLTLISSDANDPTTCDPHKLRINGLTPAILKNTHRFIRLSRKLGWIFRDLDRALSSVQTKNAQGAIDITGIFLQYLSHSIRLGTRLNAAPQDIFSWWSNRLDTNLYLDHTADAQPEVPSVYDATFRVKTVTTASIDLFASIQNSPPATLPTDPFELDQDRRELKYLGLPGATTIPVSQNAARVMAALNISSSDLALLLNLTARQTQAILALVTDTFATSDDKLASLLGTTTAKLTALTNYPDCAVLDVQTLWTLSFLYRLSSFAKALGLSIHDFLIVWQMAGSQPVFSASLDAIRFAYWVATIRLSSFTVAELDYLLRHEFIPSSPAAPDDKTVSLYLDNLRAGLLQIAKDNTFRVDPADPLGVTSDPNGDLTRSKLALLNWDSDAIAQVVATLNGTITYQAQLTNPLSAGFSIPNATGIFSVAMTSQLPAGFSFPSALNGAVTYNSTTQQLIATRFLTASERSALSSSSTASGVTGFATAVTNLFTLQDGLEGDIIYDSSGPTLTFRGPMTLARWTLLDGATGGTTDYKKAVRSLFEAPRWFIARNMRTFSIRDFSTSLATLPAGLIFPDSLAGKAYFDSDSTPPTLHYRGVMSDQNYSILKGLSTDTTYGQALDNLYNQPISLAPAQGDSFLNVLLATGTTAPFGSDISSLFDADVAPADRFALVLPKLLPYLKTQLSADFVVQSAATAFQLDSRSAESLLSTWLYSPDDAQPNPALKARCLSVWLDPLFAESNADITMSSDNFPKQFNTFVRMQKSAMVASRLKLTYVQLGWLFTYGSKAGWLDLNSLPVASGGASGSFTAWRRTVALTNLRDALPDGENLLSQIFAAAYTAPPTPAPADPTAPVRALLNTSLQWNVDDLKYLTSSQAFGFTTLDSYKDERALRKLLDCFHKINRLGSSAQQCKQWCAPKLTVKDAISAKSAARSKYNAAGWLQMAKPLNDALRSKQRTALVDYLIAHPAKDSTGRPIWNDDDGLYGYFLIDVEMSACMKTSRLVQAVAAVQLFVQRCLLNLEPGVSLNDDQATEWRQWRKYYRVWEANREVFLYPENWIEPELRDDKSPFFLDFENELLQDNMTSQLAEDALVHYLEKLHEVARLEIVALFHEQEPADTGNGETDPIDRLHVVGRTATSPNLYYYRRLENSIWTPWEKMDVDVTGDQLVMFVTNRRLYVFWPVLSEAEQPPSTSTDSSGPTAPKRWNVNLAFSSYRDGRWSGKKVSVGQLNYTDPIGVQLTDRQRFTFRITLNGEQMSILCYAVDNITPPPPAANSAPLDVPPQQWYYTAIYGKVVDKNNNYAAIPGVVVTLMSPVDVPQYQDPGETVPIDTEYYPVDQYTTNADGWYYFPSYSDSDHTSILAFAYQVVATAGPAFQNASITNDVPSPGVSTQINFQYLQNFIFLGTPAQPTTTPLPPNLRHDILGLFQFSCGEDLVSFAATQPGGYITSPIYATTIDGMLLTEDNSRPENADPLFFASNTITALEVLARTPGTFHLLQPAWMRLDSSPIPPDQFFQDDACTYYLLTSGNPPKTQFVVFYHPYVCDFLRMIDALGARGLLKLAPQQFTDVVSSQLGSHPAIQVSETFLQRYAPSSLYLGMIDQNNPPRQLVDFSASGTYSIYNWEIFFHIPFETAVRLSANQRFEEAQTWFHYIFDPTAAGVPSASASDRAARFWKVKPFHDLLENPPQTLQDLLDDAAELNDEVALWEKSPFNPHLIARHRYLAYMKSVVMKYVANLLDWGDMLFAMDTLESVGEATQLYILAGQILGKRPERRPARAKPEVSTFDTLNQTGIPFDSFSDTMVAIESFIFPSGGTSGVPTMTSTTPVELPYFCLSGNDVLLGYWDRVADRLFKLRNCMNIEGVVRELPLFQPPIDPAILVRAAAAGVDLSSVLSDLNAPLPYYRFNVLMQKALDLYNEVKSHGAALLSALEKRDAEALASLRSQHEVQTLSAMQLVKEQQITESQDNLTASQESLAVAQVRAAYYRGLVQSGASSPAPTPAGQGQLGNGSLKLNPNEAMQLSMMGQAQSLQQIQSLVEYLGNILSLIPDTKAAAPTSAGTTFGGSQIGSAIRSVSAYMGSMVSMMNATANMSGILGGHARRSEEWQFQLNLANAEVTQLTTQVEAAKVRVALAEADLAAHKLQIDNAKDVDTFLREKYTNQDLYVWMTGQVAGTYFQSYQLAYSLAKRAEQCFRYELGLGDSNFIQFGYWDSLKKGLLAGERLSYDLKRMDAAYLDQNRREYEIVKHVSVLSLDPSALLQLRQTGECSVSIPESCFDLDFPGHFLRRIKSVGLTLPCVTGPYTGVACTLTLMRSSLRRVSQMSSGSAGYSRKSSSDLRFVDIAGGTQSIVTSHGQNDSGLFETNFRDERFLPFEGMGAVSEWRLQLPADFRQFDYDTISDVILHMRYTARDGGGELRDGAAAELQKALNEAVTSSDEKGIFRIFSARQEFPDSWYRFQQSLASTNTRSITFPLIQERFPFLFRASKIQIASIDVMINFRDEYLASNDPNKLKWTFVSGDTAIAPDPSAPGNNLLPNQWLGTIWTGSADVNLAPGKWTLALWTAPGVVVSPDSIEDVFLVCHYAVSK